MAIHRHQSYADAVRDALGRLEAVGLRWYLTGSEALGPYAEPRQTADTDIVVDLPVERFDAVFAPFADAYAVARPIRVPHRWLASQVSLDGWGKLDIVLRDCANLLRANPDLDRAYLDRHAAELGVADLLSKVRGDVA